MKYIIREMKNDDIQPVQNVAKTSWNSTYEGIIPVEIQNNFLKNAYNDDMMEKRLSYSLMLVAETDSEIVGFANFSSVNEAGQTELSAIYLHPEYQGYGMGSALLNIGIEKLDGIQEVQLDVEKENIIGMTFYKAKGFKVVNEYDDNFDGHILKTVRMSLVL